MKRCISKIIAVALREDIGREDITSHILIPKDKISKAFIITREPAVISGLDIAKKVFLKVDKKIFFHPYVKNGTFVRANTKVALIKGKTKSLLKAERVALNFLSHLSAIATKTRLFVKKIYPYKAEIIDTRKTTPGLRILEKEAIKSAGGTNHRFNLHEMVLIKDNHRQACRDILPFYETIKQAQRRTKKDIEVEVENLQEFKEALRAEPHYILLDNMSLRQIKRAVELFRQNKTKKKIQLEVSGGVTLKNVRAIAKTGIHRISIGALTNTRKAIDFTMELIS